MKQILLAQFYNLQKYVYTDLKFTVIPFSATGVFLPGLPKILAKNEQYFPRKILFNNFLQNTS